MAFVTGASDFLIGQCEYACIRLKAGTDLFQARENIRQKQQWQEERPDFPVVNVYLPPYGRKILAPAREHIPFFFSKLAMGKTMLNMWIKPQASFTINTVPV